MTTATPSPTASSPTPLIIDTDPGVDDVLAILLALASPEVSVKALTLTFGNTDLDYAYSNVLRTGAVLRHHLSDPAVPQRTKDAFRSFDVDAEPILVATGAEGPMGGDKFTASYFHGRDGLSGLHSLPDDPFPAPASPTAPLKRSEKAADEVILDLLRAHPEGSVRIAALGPLTNLALACRRDPDVFARVGAISVMGGALDVAGNTSAVAEFNTFADPWAARYLFEEATRLPAIRRRPGGRLPIDLLPLDITTRHTVPYSRLVTAPHYSVTCHPNEQTDIDRKAEANAGASRLERFISTFLTHPRLVTNSYARPEDFHPDKHDLFQAHDPLAVAHAIFVPTPTPTPASAFTSTTRDGDDVDAVANANAKANGWKHQLRRFNVECTGEVTRGMCVVDRRGLEMLDGVNKAKAKARADAVGTLDGDVDVAEGGDKAGLVNVVVDSPGSRWFADMFLDRLGLV